MTVVFFGLADQEHKLKELAANCGNCRFIDPVPMNRMVEMATEADIGIQAYLPTNLNNECASPNRLFKHVQAVLPVVATDTSFLRVVMLGERTVLVFDGEDPRSRGYAIDSGARASPQ